MPENIPVSEHGNNNGFQLDFNKMLGHIKEWPAVFTEFLKNPTQVASKFPEKGDWNRPVSWILASILVIGLLSGGRMGGFSVGLTIQSIIAGGLGVFVGAFIMDWIIGLFGKRPGYYRMLYFSSFLTPLTVIPGLLFYFSISLNIIVTLVIEIMYLYLFYHFLIGAASYTKKKALIFVLVMVGIVLFLTLGTIAAVLFAVKALVS